MQYMEIFFSCKISNFRRKKLNMFNIFAQNIDCGYTLELPRRGGSNEYPQCMFWTKNKKIRYTPANSQFFYIKVGLKGYTFHGHDCLMQYIKVGCRGYLFRHVFLTRS